MKAALAVAAAALALAGPALAAPPSLLARAVYVQNATTGEVLYASHARDPLAIASITKLMTALVALERVRLSDIATVPYEATTIGGSAVPLRAGERITVRELLEAALVQSANDAAWTLADHAGGGDVDRFVARMNAKARALGLRDTHFVRPDGMDVTGHYSSARDVTKLARVAMRRPEIRSVVKERSAVISGGRALHTWNDLLYTYPGIVGVKTGHTSVAGWSEVAAVHRRGLTIYATVIGSPSREQRNADLTRLLDWSLAQYRLLTVVRRGQAFGAAATGFDRGQVRLVAPRPLRLVWRVGRPLVERVVMPGSVDLPVRKGEQLGSVRVYAGGRLAGTRPLVAARSVSRPGFFGRMGWYAGRTTHHLLGVFG